MWMDKLPSGKYNYIERYIDPMTGKKKRVSIAFDKNTAKNRKMAATILQERIDQALRTAQVQKKDITLKELAELYNTEQLRTVKQSTYHRNCGACKSIAKILGPSTIVSKLNAGYIRERFLATGRAPGTLNEWMVRLKALLRWGYRNDYIEDISYLDKIERFKDVSHRKKIEDKFLESSEVELLLDEMKVEKWKVLTEFLVLSGLRFGEAAALEKSDVDLRKRVIHVTKTYDVNNDIVTTPKTDFSIRDIYIQDELAKVCRKALRMAQNDNVVRFSNLLFTGTVREHVDHFAYNKYLKENSMKAIGRSITPHTLRHTHASLLLEQEVDVDTISRRLGHADSKITKEIYLHITKKKQEQENSKIKEIQLLAK